MEGFSSKYMSNCDNHGPFGEGTPCNSTLNAAPYSLGTQIDGTSFDFDNYPNGV